MYKERIFYHKIVTIIIALIWFINGLICKVLNLVPRHELIVKKILNTEYSRNFVVVIGISEILMAFWILTGFKRKLNAFIQIIIIAGMNIIEFVFVPELLLWGRFNSLFALLLIAVIVFNEYYLSTRSHSKHINAVIS